MPPVANAHQLGSFLARAVPVFALYLIEARSLRQCGTISDQFAAVARHYGFDAYVVAEPGHFMNEVVTSNGIFRIDMTAAQFRDTPYEDNLRTLLAEIVENPYRAATFKRIARLSPAARLPTAPVPGLYDPVPKFDRYAAKVVPRLLAGRLDPRDELDQDYLRLLRGKTFGSKLHRRR
ncbi:MAG: hypothetical protein ACHREM_08805 [Polyangiales bacterium]